MEDKNCMPPEKSNWAMLYREEQWIKTMAEQWPIRCASYCNQNGRDQTQQEWKDCHKQCKAIDLLLKVHATKSK
jgi:hypothetical protein